jgi:hypothetical protein
VLVFYVCSCESGVCVCAPVPCVSQHHHYCRGLGNKTKLAVCGHSKLSCRFLVTFQEGWHQTVKSSKFTHLIGLLSMIEVHRLMCVVCLYSTLCPAIHVCLQWWEGSAETKRNEHMMPWEYVRTHPDIHKV